MAQDKRAWITCPGGSSSPTLNVKFMYVYANAPPSAVVRNNKYDHTYNNHLNIKQLYKDTKTPEGFFGGRGCQGNQGHNSRRNSSETTFAIRIR